MVCVELKLENNICDLLIVMIQNVAVYNASSIFTTICIGLTFSGIIATIVITGLIFLKTPKNKIHSGYEEDLMKTVGYFSLYIMISTARKPSNPFMIKNFPSID